MHRALDRVIRNMESEKEHGEKVRENIRKFVMSHMHYNGENREKLTNQQWVEVYLHGDGFGSLDLRQASEQCYDWSHVRDSSPMALFEMSKKIKEFLK